MLTGRQIGQRRACWLTGLSRSGYRYAAVGRPDEEELKKRLQELAVEHPRFGYRRQLALLRREGWQVNHKRVYRLWHDQGLCLPRIRPRKRRPASPAYEAYPTGLLC